MMNKELNSFNENDYAVTVSLAEYRELVYSQGYHAKEMDDLQEINSTLAMQNMEQAAEIEELNAKLDRAEPGGEK